MSIFNDTSDKRQDIRRPFARFMPTRVYSRVSMW